MAYSPRHFLYLSLQSFGSWSDQCSYGPWAWPYPRRICIFRRRSTPSWPRTPVLPFLPLSVFWIGRPQVEYPKLQGIPLVISSWQYPFLICIQENLKISDKYYIFFTRTALRPFMPFSSSKLTLSFSSIWSIRPLT